MYHNLISFWLLSILIIITPWGYTALAIETKASHAILIDADTDTVLFEKNSNTPMTPSSMSKLMTIYLVFERLRDGSLALQDKFLVSEKAWRKKGSKMFIKVNDYVTVNDLLLGISVQSGNDACIALAEGLMGSEEAFTEAMNKKAQELGLTNSHFKNASGWPEEGHVMSARDLAILARIMIKEFPEYYHYFAIKEFVYNGIKQGNRNLLLYKNIGVDGLKTGHTDEGGYGVVVSAVRNGRRLIAVVNGLADTKERTQEAELLLQHGFLNFDNLIVAKKGEKLEDAPLWMGKNKTIPLVVGEDIIFTIRKAQDTKFKAKIEYQSPILAPVSKGTLIANIIVEGEGIQKTYPVYAVEDVAKLPYLSRIGRYIYSLIKK